MKRMRNRNIAPKIISILFSLVLWIYVMGTINPDAHRNLTNMPVVLMNTEELDANGLAIKGSGDFRVKVRLTGKRDRVFKVSPDEIQIKADLRGCREGENNIPLEVTAPNNVEIDITPRFINVELEKIISRRKEVRVLTFGTPEKDFVVGDLEYEPTVVEIEGPESCVNSVESVIAELDVTEASENLAMNLPLRPVDSKGDRIENVEAKTPHVRVSLKIDLLKSVPIKPDLRITTDTGYVVADVKVDPTDVILRGHKGQIREITEVITEPIEFSGLNQDKTVNVGLKLPEGTALQDDISVTVNLHLEKMDESTFKISRDEITFNNIGEGLEVDKSSIPENIDVRIIGLRDVLDSIGENDIKIEVDLNELSADKYSIELTAQLPFTIEKNINELYLSPDTIDIELVNKE